MFGLVSSCLLLAAPLGPNARAEDQLLVEAESFSNRGGWKLDTQFIEEMGSPYLLAHGLGKKVEDATTDVTFPSTGKYQVFVRTKDWVARWGAAGAPGKFQLSVDGKKLDALLGTRGKKWDWQPAGSVEISDTSVRLGLHDLTGFDGRCDAILFTKSGEGAPPNDSAVLPAWRRKLLGLKETPTLKDGYDLVVVGGGYSGMGAAISAARMGCRVALIQNRPVLGGNGSSEVRVWAMGNIRRGKFPRIGEIIDEIQDHATKSPGTYEEFEDAKKEKVVRAEKNIDLYLNHHAYRVTTEGKKISGVFAFDTRTSEHKEFRGRNFVDCTGHGTIGYLAGANWEMTPNGRMGMSNMWRWAEAKTPVSFPETDWALDLEMKDFPYPRNFHGQWFWEGGFDKDPLADAEGIRDWNLRAVFGAFNAMKNRDGRSKHEKAVLTWVAYIGGTRESRRLMGDVVLTQEDIVSKRDFDDGCVPSTWSIDLHYPKQQYAKKFPDNPFISIAKHDRRIDRSFGYPVPYRCFYSRNIDNLFMAGRCISVTHEALGTTRVMKTCGMMGEVVGKAASICSLKDCSPREVHGKHLAELKKLMELPGQARRENVTAPLVMPKLVLPSSPYGPPSGKSLKTLSGVVMDDSKATRVGQWTQGEGLKGYYENGYRYASADSGASVTYRLKARETAQYEVRISYLHHENRGKSVPVIYRAPGIEKTVRIDMSKKAPLENGFIALGNVKLVQGAVCEVSIDTRGARGVVHVDVAQLVKTR
ncbi:MAG: FAD-dependent oxidoreductase [Planctomycetota bacterium]|nr:FAD-dependent oxidoreductase [Planctomycetota bacterium]